MKILIRKIATILTATGMVLWASSCGMSNSDRQTEVENINSVNSKFDENYEDSKLADTVYIPNDLNFSNQIETVDDKNSKMSIMMQLESNFVYKEDSLAYETPQRTLIIYSETVAVYEMFDTLNEIKRQFAQDVLYQFRPKAKENLDLYSSEYFKWNNTLECAEEKEANEAEEETINKTAEFLISIGLPEEAIVIGNFMDVSHHLVLTEVGTQQLIDRLKASLEEKIKKNNTFPEDMPVSPEKDFEYIDYTDDGAENEIIIIRYTGIDPNVNIPAIINGKKVVGIGSAFQGRNDIKFVIIPEGVRFIEKTFYNCNRLLEVRLPETLKEIRSETFTCCIDLREMIIPDSVKSIFGAFDYFDSSIEKFYIGAGLEELNTSLDAKYYEVSEDNKYFLSENGILYNKDKTVLIKVPDTYECTSFEVQEGVTTIGSQAFYNCDNLEKILLPESVTYIGSSAFKSCEKLKKVNLPEGIEKIEFRTFDFCKSIDEITLPKSLKSIDMQAFSNCSNLKNIIIPDNVTEMGYWVFEDCLDLIVTYKGKSYTLETINDFYDLFIRI